MGARAAKRAEGRAVEREIARELTLARHDSHDPALPCRPALGTGLCYPAPAGVRLVPWREALKNPQQGGEPG